MSSRTERRRRASQVRQTGVDGRLVDPEHGRHKDGQQEDEQDHQYGQHDDRACLEELEVQHIRKVLNHYNGETTKAAEALGISRTTLYRRLKEIRESE